MESSEEGGGRKEEVSFSLHFSLFTLHFIIVSLLTPISSRTFLPPPSYFLLISIIPISSRTFLPPPSYFLPEHAGRCDPDKLTEMTGSATVTGGSEIRLFTRAMGSVPFANGSRRLES